MEATGAYGEALALHIHQAGHIVSVVNPAAIMSFAASCLSRTKTDKVDAELIAHFCVVQQPLAWTPPAPEVRQLQALVRRLEALVEMRTMESNRLEAIITINVDKASVEEHIAYLDHQIKQTENLIRTHTNNYPRLKQQSALLDSIPGIGETTAATLRAEITDITQYESARQDAAFAGLNQSL
ncbi:MAG: transposase [Acidobacteriota bacterium]|nr:transposase [Acidobacteriota bacterium]